MNVKLVLDQGAKKQAFRLRSAETIVGRRQGCELRIPSETVSRRHCRLSYRNDYLSVEDLASANGTYVNGERVAGSQVLRPGDRLTVGAVTFVVQYQLSAAAIEYLLKEYEADLAPEVVDDGGRSEQISIVMPVEEDSAQNESGKTKQLPKLKPKKHAKKKGAPKKGAPKKGPARAAAAESAQTDESGETPDNSALLRSLPCANTDELRDILSKIEDE